MQYYPVLYELPKKSDIAFVPPMAERCASESPPHIGLKRPCGDSDGACAAVDFVSQSDAVPPSTENAEMDAQCAHVISTGKGPASSADWAYDRSKNIPCSTSSSWKRVLEPVVQDPGKHISTSCCWFDDRVAVVYDGFPKARVHLLIVARDVSGELLLSNGHLCMRARPLILTAYFRPVTHLPLATASLLVHMHRVALAFVHRLRRSLQLAAVAFQAGFHSVPSLVPLHMHVMSRDFDSLSLKKKLHFNSFQVSFTAASSRALHRSSRHQAPFFISASSAAAGAGAAIDQAAMERSLKAPMKCHGCGLVLGDALAALQAHFRTCPAIQALLDLV